jgi:hypothetical protein
MNTIAIIAAVAALLIFGVLVVKFIKSKTNSKPRIDVFDENLGDDETIKTASELCQVESHGPEPVPEPDTDNTYTPKDTSEIEVVEPEDINPISQENQICPFEIKTLKNGDIIKTDADRTDGVDPLGELEKIIATAPKTEIKKTSKKCGKKTTKSTKTTKKTKGKKTQKFTVPVVKVVEVPAETPKKRGRKSKKKEG